MFYDRAKKLLATGLGLAVLTKEKAEELVKEWVQEGELSKEEGKELLDNWVRKVDTEKEELRTRIQKEVHKIVEGAGAVTQEELDEIRVEMKRLDKRGKALETAAAAAEEE